MPAKPNPEGRAPSVESEALELLREIASLPLADVAGMRSYFLPGDIFDRVRVLLGSIAALTEEEETRRGQMLADVFKMRHAPSAGRYQLLAPWGDKYPLGIYRTARRIILEGI